MQVQLETAIKKAPKDFVIEEQIRVINAKEYLTLKEAALLLNISALTLRRWTLEGKMQANKLGKKWVFEATQIKISCQKSLET
jgi:excisionase family DNA binding protein